MFELRFFCKDTGFGDYHTPVLQYRYSINIEEIHIHPPIWSDWEDVPLVCEKLAPYDE